MYAAFEKTSYFSGNFKMLSSIELFTIWKERPVTSHPIGFPSICFSQGKEAMAGNLKLSWGDADSIAGINMTIWVQFGPTSPQANLELHGFD